MSKSASDQRMIENESVFRRYNEEIEQRFEETKRIAIEDKQEHLLNDNIDMPLHFYCECSDENCRKRIVLLPSLYKKIHRQRNRFIVVNEHEVTSIEHVTDKQKSYSIIDKYKQPPESVDGLNATLVNNT